MYTYSQPFADVRLVFVAKKGASIEWNSLRDSRPYTIGNGQGNVYTDDFDKADFLKKEAVRSIELNLKKLLENRIDLILSSQKVFIRFIASNFPDKLNEIEIVSKPLTENKIYNGFSKSNPLHSRYARDFNRGLQLIRADGTYKASMKKHGFK